MSPMSKPQDEIVEELKDDTQWGANPETEEDDMPVAREGLIFEAEDRKTRVDNPDEESEEEGQRQRNEKLGLLVIAGECQTHVPRGNGPHSFDVVAVHGIHGDSENTWTTDENGGQPGSNWLKKLHEDYPRSRIMTFGYDASHTRSGIYTTGHISEKALQLLDDLVELRRGLNPVHEMGGMGRPLIFISHDLGGIIVKKALWTATVENNKYRDIKDWTKLLIFFGCLHRCSSAQDMEDKVTYLLPALGVTRPFGIVNSVKELARCVTEINETFIASRTLLNTHILSIHSSEQDASLGILDRYTSTLELPSEKRLECPGSHRDMCKVPLDGDSYRFISRQISPLAYHSRPSGDSLQFLLSLRYLAAPVSPLESLPDSEDRYDWVTAHESYKTWLNGHGPGILHIHGTTDTSDASEFVFRHLNENREMQQKKEILTRFAFKKHDDRRNSAPAMLSTLLTQIFNEDPDFYDTVERESEEMVHYCSWTQTDLLLIFRIVLSNWDHDNITCVISGFDECDDSRVAFLEDIRAFARHTERRFKIAITSIADSNIQAALADWPTINLDDHQKDPNVINRNLASDVDCEVLELVQQRPEYFDFEKRIYEKLLKCGQDKQWRHLVMHQLRFSKEPSTKSGIERRLKLLPPTTPKDIFARILATVSLEMQTWARNALVWILHTFHPLSLRELGVALALQDDSSSNIIRDNDELVYRNIAREIDDVFKGMFIVEDNEIHFSHPDAREFLLNETCGHKDVWYNVAGIAHQQITDTCYLYLSMHQVQKSITSSYIDCPADLLCSPIYIPRHSLRSYAIKYWPAHYKLIPETMRPTKGALEFFQNRKAMRIWTEAYWSLSNPISRADRPRLSILSILAGLGLQDLVTQCLKQTFQPNQASFRALALSEAARNGHAAVIRKALFIDECTDWRLQDALVAASSCCDEGVLDLLIAQTGKLSPDFEWPSAPLLQSARFGLGTVVKKLLKHGASLQVTNQIQELTPLHLAARHGHANVVEVLLENHANLTALDREGQSPLHTASKNGHATVVSLLLDAGADCNAVDKHKTTALDLACRNGNHEVVRTMLTNSKCDMGCDRQGEWSPLTITADRGFLQCTKYLLKMSASTEVQGIEDWTPLRHAAVKGHIELCQLLLEHGADPNTCSGGSPILAELVDVGDLEIVKALVEQGGAAINATLWDDRTALQRASSKGHTAIVAYLLKHGANVHYTNDNGQTSIALAASSGFAEIVQLLIENGADLQCQSSSGWTHIIHLCFDYAETTRVLLKNGVDVNSVMDNGYTPLYLAASRNYPEVVKVLLSYNPDLEITYYGSYQHTVLIAAVEYGYTEVIRLLLEARANINYRYARNNFALQLAVIRNAEDVLRILMEYNPKVNLVDDDGDTALNCLASSNSVTIVRILVNGGADPEIRNKYQDTALCLAVAQNNHEIVKYLSKKAKINIVGGPRGGPLHIACSYSNLELAKMLIDAGADVNLVDPALGTPLQSACRSTLSSYEGKQESVILHLMNEANADLALVGGEYGCASNAACGRSNSEIVNSMLDKGARIDVKDCMERTAIHFAASRSMGNFRAILEAGADVEVEDKMGRTALHWASASGIVGVVDHIISLSRDLVNRADVDGWTALLWAARGCSTRHRMVLNGEQEEVIKLLLARGADPCAIGRGWDREWSATKIARYHGVDSEIIELLEEKEKEALKARGEEVAWNEDSYESRRAVETSICCDCCFAFIFGIRYQCERCLAIDFCYKCYLSREAQHPGHSFKPVGSEYVSASETFGTATATDTDEDEADEDDSEEGGNDSEEDEDDGEG